MRILMCNSFYYLRGGAERYFFDLSNLLTSKGHEVIPFCMQHERNYPSEYSDYFVSYIDYPSLLNQKTDFTKKLDVVNRVIYNQEAKRKIRQIIKDRKPDIAHIHGIGHEISPSILDEIKQLNIPIVQTVHDYGLLCPNSSFISKGEICERCKIHRYYHVVLHRCKRDNFSASLLACLEKYFHYLIKICERNVDIFISPSKFLQHKMLEYGIRNKIIHLPYHVDVEHFKPCYSSGEYFLFAGRLTAIKGLNTLLEAMKSIEPAQLLIAGDGELREPLQAYVSENKLNNIKILGHLEADELISLIQKASFTVCPSEWYENYPLTILESFSCGKPVIASNIGAIPGIIEDGHNGLLFEPQNVQQLVEKIQFMLDNPQRTVEMGRNGRRQIEIVNDPHRHYQQIIEVYESLIMRNKLH